MCCIDKTPHKENASSYEQLANENGWNQIIRLTRESKTIPYRQIELFSLTRRQAST